MSGWADTVREIVVILTKARVAFALWASALVIILMPDTVLGERRKPDLTGFVGIAGVVAFVFWVVAIAIFIYEQVRAKQRARSEKRDTLKYLDTLSPREQLILARALCLGYQTVCWNESDPAVDSLVSKALLAKVPTIIEDWSKPVTIPPSVWEHLQAISDSFIVRARQANPNEAESLKTRNQV